MDDTFKESVIEYLNKNPDFLLKNKTLLSELLLPHPVADNQSGNVVSLVEVQTRIQRDEIHELQDSLNAQTSDSAHLYESLKAIRTNLPLLAGTSSLTESYENFCHILKYHFSATKHLSIVFSQTPYSPSLNDSGIEFVSEHDKRKTFLLDLFQRKKALCGFLQDEIKFLLFGKDSRDLTSFMLYPIQVLDNDGLIALGSNEKDRYGIGSEVELICLFCDVFAKTIESSIKENDSGLLDSCL